MMMLILKPQFVVAGILFVVDGHPHITDLCKQSALQRSLM